MRRSQLLLLCSLFIAGLAANEYDGDAGCNAEKDSSTLLQAAVKVRHVAGRASDHPPTDPTDIGEPHGSGPGGPPLTKPICSHLSVHDGMRVEHFVEGALYFLGSKSTHGISPKLTGVHASADEDVAKSFVQSQIEPWISEAGNNLYTFNDSFETTDDWRKQVVPKDLPKYTARMELLQHMYAARFAWVALNALDGREPEKQRKLLKQLYLRVPEKLPFSPQDQEAIVQKRLELAQHLRDTLLSQPMLQLLETAKSCFLPHDHHLFGHNRQLSQRSRVRPVGPLTKDSVVLLSEPDGSITEKDDLKMPMMMLGTGYGDCYKGKHVVYPPESDSGVLTEDNCAPYYPAVGFYRDAVNAGIKGIDTAFIYDTEEQIGREAPNVFITTKSMTPQYRKMLGALHSTDKMADQLRALQRHSVNILYNHEDGGDDNEWLHREKEIHSGHARALGASGVRDALGHAKCVKDGRCNVHVSAIQETVSPCDMFSNKMIQKMMDNQEVLGNATLVGHSTIFYCTGEPLVEHIAKRLGRSAAQVKLRANLEQGIPMLVQTSKQEHLRQDLAVFDFHLSPGDLSQILLTKRLYTTTKDFFEESVPAARR